uniref:Uncharacterized protein n=1 Tax=Anguilla anguilla TaxID=7936 RepID=A0A0E9T6Q9_ANGAN
MLPPTSKTLFPTPYPLNPIPYVLNPTLLPQVFQSDCDITEGTCQNTVAGAP